MTSFIERSISWNGDPTASEPTDRETSWKDFDTSINAISFGFAATAILIALFLIMAIFEHLIKPRASVLQPQNAQPQAQNNSVQKLSDSSTVKKTSFPSNLSVLMPGQQCPTYLAQPAPLPCSREGIEWPPHDQQHNALPSP